MPAYLIAHVTVKDDAWMPEYAAMVHDIVHRHDVGITLGNLIELDIRRNRVVGSAHGRLVFHPCRMRAQA